MNNGTSPERKNILLIISLAVMLAGPLTAMLLVSGLALTGNISSLEIALASILSALLFLAGSVFLVIRVKRYIDQAGNGLSGGLAGENALKESHQRLLDIIDFLPDAIFVIDNNRRVIIWNRAMEELTGIPGRDMLGKGDYEYALPFYGERRPILIDLCLDYENLPEESIQKQYPEIRRINKSITAETMVPGTVRKGAHLWGIAQPLYSGRGEILGAIESLRDVTEKKLSEEKYSTIFRLSPFVLTISSISDGRYIEASDRFYELTGYSRKEVIGRTAFDINIWADASDRERIVESLRTKGRVINDEVRFRAKSGDIRTMFFSAEIVVIAGQPCLLAVNVDITDRKKEQELIKRQNEELLASNEEFETMNEELVKSQKELSRAHELLSRSEEMLSAAYRLAPVSMTLSRMSDGHYVEVSDHFLFVTEYSREEVIGHTSIELNIWTDLGERDQVISIVLEKGSISDRELVFQSRSGKKYTMLFSAQLITISGEAHLASIATDITERIRSMHEKQRLEEQLIQAQKMESVGRLAGGVAHDFNNLLTAIIGNTDFALRHSDDREDLISRLEVVKSAAVSAAQLTRQLLAFSRKETIEPRTIDINSTIEGTHKILARLIGEDIDLRISTKASWYIKTDPGQVEQIILNLSVNARDAMPDGGLLSITTENTGLDDYYCRFYIYARPGEYVMISITDTGMGMTDEVRQNLFEPFYTTKSKGHGTGLGLAMVYGAVKQNNGLIEVYSVPGEGTTFKIYFPRETDIPEEKPAPRDEEKITGGSETILLVEDDHLVRDYASQILEKLGYTVLVASSGEEALSISERTSGTIHLLLTDVILPGMNGKLLSERLTSARPGIRVLFTSGYTEDIIAYRGIINQGINFISKPYTEIPLAKKVRSVLDS